MDYTTFQIMLALNLDPSLSAPLGFRKMDRVEAVDVWHFNYNRHHGYPKTDDKAELLKRSNAAEQERRAYKQIAEALQILGHKGDMTLSSFKAQNRNFGEVAGVQVPAEYAAAAEWVLQDDCDQSLRQGKYKSRK